MNNLSNNAKYIQLSFLDVDWVLTKVEFQLDAKQAS